MKLSEKFLKYALRKGSYVGERELDEASIQANKLGASLSTYLINTGLISKQLLGQAIAEALDVPFIDLKSQHVMPRYSSHLGEEYIVNNRLLPVRQNDEQIVFATDQPESLNLKSELEREFEGKQVIIGYALEEQVSERLTRVKAPMQERIEKILQNGKPDAPQMYKVILEEAFDRKASDIHIEPQAEGVTIRFRIDGVMQIMLNLSHELANSLVNIIKVKSKLKTDNHFSPQDGSLQYQSSRENIDMRVSIVPTIFGEKAVLRILSAYVTSLNFSDLGLNQKHIGIIEEAIKKPFGMVVIVGPTGSGKTTTLYGTLYRLNSEKVNISTIEDPVEYRLAGVNHIQVNDKVGLSFLTGLKSIVRQDPDIILLGEIRDSETADVAVNAALTGHLMLSTFHANNAPTAIPRLIDMGVEPFLLSSALEVVAAQRLVRRLCGNCRYSEVLNQHQVWERYPHVQHLLPGDEVTLYSSKGCEVCANTGYDGRVAVYEMIQVTKEMKELILESPSTNEILELARKQGMSSMQEDGIAKAQQGITTVEEVLRVTEQVNV